MINILSSLINILWMKGGGKVVCPFNEHKNVYFDNE